MYQHKNYNFQAVNEITEYIEEAKVIPIYQQVTISIALEPDPIRSG